MKMKVYADNAATTKLNKEVLDAMMPYLTDNYANPSGTYSEGVNARRAINDARHAIASTLNAFDREIIFTSGGSEADNIAIIGTMEALKEKGRHLITTNIEHKAILQSCAYLEANGFRVTYVPVKDNGIVDFDDIIKAITDDTVMISVMYANNEIGTIQPIREIGRIAKEKGIVFHTDAVQAYGKYSIIPEELNIDLLSASAHKFNGPKGAGFLYVKRGTPIKAFIHGGSQEYGLRAGTENVASIVGMGKAAELALSNYEVRTKHEDELVKYLWENIKNEIPDSTLNGDENKRLPNILNISIPGVEGDSLLISLDMKGIAASTGSACMMSLDEPSHVLTAIGKTEDTVRESVRFSFDADNTIEEMDYIITNLKESVMYLRKIRGYVG